MRELSLARVFSICLAVVLAFTLVTAATAQDRPQVIAVNKALQYFAERLLGGDADVVFPVPAGVDPSFWRPSIADISMVQSADLILLNGAGFATWVDRVSLPRSRVVNTSAGIEDQFIVTESITHSHGDGGEHSHEGIASYTWLDPVLAIAQAEAIASAIISRGLADANEVDARLADLTSELTQLDAATREALEAAKGVAMIATHPRYQYFARRYALSITSLEWEARAMPTKDEFAELDRLANELGARILFWEAQPPEDAIEIAEGLGLANVVFEPWATEGTQDSYINSFTGAVAGITQALSGSLN